MIRRTIYRKIQGVKGREFIVLDGVKVYFNSMGVIPSDTKVGKYVISEYRLHNGLYPGKVATLSVRFKDIHKVTLRELNAAIKKKGLSNNEATRFKGEFYLLHILSNGRPIPLFHSKDSSEVLDYINNL